MGKRISYTSKTMSECSRRGWKADIAERKVPSRNAWPITKDLFGFIDVVALSPEKVVGIQCTSRPLMRDRAAKILEKRRCEALAWLAAGGAIEVWGWKKYAKPVNRRYWRVTVWRLVLRKNKMELVKENDNGDDTGIHSD